MGKFPEVHNLPRLNHDETENLNKLITGKEIKSITKSHPTNKSQWSEAFTDEFHQTFKDEEQSFSNSFKKLKRNELFQTHFMSQHCTDAKTRQACHKKKKITG